MKARKKVRSEIARHLWAIRPNIGWLWDIDTIAEDYLRENRRRAGGKALIAAIRAAREAHEKIKRLGIKSANDPRADAIAAAMKALHLAWQADYLERSLAHAGHTSGGKKSGASRRSAKDTALSKAAGALNRLESRNSVKTHGLRDIADESGMLYDRLRKLGLGPIQARAASLRQRK